MWLAILFGKQEWCSVCRWGLSMKVRGNCTPNQNWQGRSQPHSPGWARVPLSSFFLKFQSIFLIFPQTLLIFFLILALRVGKSPTREGPGYATENWACFMRYLKIISTSLKNILSILKQIVWETLKRHWNFSKPNQFLSYWSKRYFTCFDQ